MRIAILGSMNADDSDLAIAHTSSGAEALAEGPELAYRIERFGRQG